MYFPLTKVQFHQSALMYMYVAMATMQLFCLMYFGKLETPWFFKCFQLRQSGQEAALIHLDQSYASQWNSFGTPVQDVTVFRRISKSLHYGCNGALI